MRFKVIQYGESTKDYYYSVTDTEWKRWNLPEQAVTIFFKTYQHAIEISDLLNREWSRFVHNPS